ncbi:MAG: S-layer homology domain-containing protein [Xenococcaceae cyanobacterium MO_188.B19]|nr:S-layer homology domain-containing protein [Xenococcaceae cyanobacterium MO_188.B19]
MIQSPVKFSPNNSEEARKRISSFYNRYGEAHLQLAYHAAVPLALTPNLLYSLWAEFQWDINRVNLNIPWIATTDLLFSCLCDEVGYELYEMNEEVRQELLWQFKQDSRFSSRRIQEVSNFLITYVQPQLNSLNIDTSDFAKAQRWTALTYIDPKQASRELASTLANLSAEDVPEWIRLTSVVETFGAELAELSDYKSLLRYARGMRDFSQGDTKAAAKLMATVLNENNQIKVAGVNLPIPKQIRANFSRLSLAANLLKRYRQLIGTTLIVIALVASLMYFLANRPKIVRPPGSIDEVAVGSPATHPLYQTSRVFNVNELKDVSPNDWFYESLRSLTDRYGIIYPYDDMTFRPNKAITKAELIDLQAHAFNEIYRIIPRPRPDAVLKEENSSCFPNKELTLNQFTVPQDVNSNDWYYDSYKTIAWITRNDYLAPSGLFRGEEAVTRGEMIVFFNQYLNGLERIIASRILIPNSNSQGSYNFTSPNQVRDISPTDYYYEDFRNLIGKFGTLTGFPNQTIRANQAASRADIAALMNRSLNQLERLITTCP